MKPKLSNREAEILSLLSQGYTRNEIALKLHVQPETIKSHQSNIIRKYGARNMVQVVAMHHGNPEATSDLQRTILRAKLRNLLRASTMKYESELNGKLDELLKEAMKD